MEESTAAKAAATRLHKLLNGELGHGFEAFTLPNIQILEVRPGFFRCCFTIQTTITDKDGNWQTGAVATLIDTIGAMAVYSLTGHFHVSVDFSISFYFAAKIQDVVEIEAKVIGYRGELPCVLVEIKRKEDGQLVAVGRQWMFNKDRTSSVKSKL